ncbi:MAG: anti-sigma factor domain-containing protein [Streptosporangiaceae bacterium]
MIRSRPSAHSLAGAYAVDALDAAGQRRFARHLTRCRECAAEVTELREVAGRLALACSSRPPDQTKERVLRITERVRQLPPVVGSTARGRYGPTTTRTRRLARTPRLALGLVAAALVAVVASWIIGRPGHYPQAQPRLANPAITAVLTAPDAVMIDAAVRPHGNAAVVMSLRERRLVFAAAGLRVLPASRCYELWLVGHGRDRPAGLLPMPKHGMTGPVIATGLHRGDRLGMSVEPAAGSHHPTSKMILFVAL